MGELDHFICSDKITLIGDAVYSWSFITNDNIYPKEIQRNKTIWNIQAGYPDHAMLTAQFDFIL
jgi:hypothetical protein